MEIKFNIEKSRRKALAQKIGELTGAEVKYLGVPGCRYQIDFFTLDKNAVLSFSDRIDTDIVEKVLNGLAEAGYESKTVAPPEETDASAESEPDIPDDVRRLENMDLIPEDQGGEDYYLNGSYNKLQDAGAAYNLNAQQDNEPDEQPDTDDTPDEETDDRFLRKKRRKKYKNGGM